MKKIILLFICVFCLTGCTLNYEIDFGRTMINESISAELDGNIYEIASTIDGDGFYLEKEIVEGKIPALKEYKAYYSRKINVVKDKSLVDLDYQYSYNNYENSYILHRCFEDVYVKNNDDSLYVSLGGNFKCFKEDDVRIKVSSIYDVVKHNADEVTDDYYIWDIKLAEDDNKIELYISKEISNKEEKSSFPIKTIIAVLLAIIGIIIIFINRKLKN